MSECFRVITKLKLQARRQYCLQESSPVHQQLVTYILVTKKLNALLEQLFQVGVHCGYVPILATSSAFLHDHGDVIMTEERVYYLVLLM